MALSFKEKRALQKIVQQKLEQLKGGALSFKEKRADQKELKDAFSKLKIKIDTGAENEKLKKLLAGDYNDETPEGFLRILKEVIEEIGDIEPVKPPTISFIEKRLAETERLSARKRLTTSEKQLSGAIYERLGDDRSFGRIRSKGDRALFGGLTTQGMKDRLGVPKARPGD